MVPPYEGDNDKIEDGIEDKIEESEDLAAEEGAFLSIGFVFVFVAEFGGASGVEGVVVEEYFLGGHSFVSVRDLVELVGLYKRRRYIYLVRDAVRREEYIDIKKSKTHQHRGLPIIVPLCPLRYHLPKYQQRKYVRHRSPQYRPRKHRRGITPGREASIFALQPYVTPS